MILTPRDPAEAKAHELIAHVLSHTRDGGSTNEEIATVVLEAFDTAQLHILDPRAKYGYRPA